MAEVARRAMQQGPQPVGSDGIERGVDGVRPRRAFAQRRRAGLVGFEDETWWSRVAQPALHAWTDDPPVRLIEQTVARADPDPKALACYGLLLRQPATPETLWLRFVEGRPLSALTVQFLTGICAQVAATGATTLVMVWDNAAWHGSKAVRRWLRDHNHQEHRTGGVRIIPCFLPTKSPWLNPIEPKWVHGQRRIVKPARLLTADELEERVCAALGCLPADHLVIPQDAA